MPYEVIKQLIKRCPCVRGASEEILSNLYAQHGLTSDILRLSQVIDILIYQEMR